MADDALSIIRGWFKRGVRCRHCGFNATREQKGARVRYSIDAEAWARRCRVARAEAGPRTPFDCPRLAAALHQARRAKDAAADG